MNVSGSYPQAWIQVHLVGPHSMLRTARRTTELAQGESSGRNGLHKRQIRRPNMHITSRRGLLHHYRTQSRSSSKDNRLPRIHNAHKRLCDFSGRCYPPVCVLGVARRPVRNSDRPERQLPGARRSICSP